MYRSQQGGRHWRFEPAAVTNRCQVQNSAINSYVGITIKTNLFGDVLDIFHLPSSLNFRLKARHGGAIDERSEKRCCLTEFAAHRSATQQYAILIVSPLSPESGILSGTTTVLSLHGLPCQSNWLFQQEALIWIYVSHVAIISCLSLSWTDACYSRDVPCISKAPHEALTRGALTLAQTPDFRYRVRVITRLTIHPKDHSMCYCKFITLSGTVWGLQRHYMRVAQQ